MQAFRLGFGSLFSVRWMLSILVCFGLLWCGAASLICWCFGIWFVCLVGLLLLGCLVVLCLVWRGYFDCYLDLLLVLCIDVTAFIVCC